MKKLLLLCLFAGFLSCNDGFHKISDVSPAEDVGGTINTICIEGHVYYVWRPSNGLAPKLENDGKPVKCD
jgi:hypothetical protein